MAENVPPDGTLLLLLPPSGVPPRCRREDRGGATIMA
jgi:hypothetical protein